ncbi:MAG: 4-alpha-glucanotransferase [Candidatus Polarisedimenticolia bacterium]
MDFPRSAGVLLHPTSLPGPYGIGDLGPAAHAYVDWLADAGAAYWQVLPVNPPGPASCPYTAHSTFAGATILVSPETMLADGLVAAADLEGAPDRAPDESDHVAAAAFKRALLDRAHERFAAALPAARRSFDEFRAAEAWWLDDFALYGALKRAHHGAAWWTWPSPFARREPKALARFRADRARDVERQAFGQWVFFDQWRRLRARAAARAVKIIGDLPMYVARDSAEVWARPEEFRLDDELRPTHVSGVPPDYFSEDGQLWGNPLYDWERMAREGYSWWIARTRAALRVVDVLRIDHFRGFAAFWEVPADAPTARPGRWVKGPGKKLFDALAAALGDLPIIAEDLGLIDKPVIALREAIGAPGMAVLQFAFSPAERSTFLPYHHRRRLVVYTGTHDNNTVRGWYEHDATEEERDFVRRYFAVPGHDIAWDFVRAALASVADLAVVPHQDLAGLGPEGRMNTPGVAEGNWLFRLRPSMLEPFIRERFRDLLWIYGRR